MPKVQGAIELTGMSSVKEAPQTVSRLAELTPQDPAVFREIRMVYLHAANQPQLAHRYFSQSIRLNPNQPDLTQMLTSSSAGATIPEMPKTANISEIELPRREARFNIRKVN